MKAGQKLWLGALAALMIGAGGIAPAAVIDDFSVAFATGFVGTGVDPFAGAIVTSGSTVDPFVFESTSVVGIGDFDAQRTATLTYSNAMNQDEYSLLRVSPVTRALRFENSSGQAEQVDFLLRYDNFGFSGGGGNLIDLSLWEAFEFEVISTNNFTTPPSLPATWTLYDSAGQASTISVNGPGIYQLSLTNFAAIDLTQVSAIEFGFSNFDGSDVFANLDIRFGALESTATVIPLPPAASLILLGMTGMALRRKFVRS